MRIITAPQFAVILLLLQLLVGCGTTDLVNFRWLDSMGGQVADLFGGDDEIEFDEDELAELEDIEPVSLLWRGSIGESEEAVLSPVFDEESLYVADEDGRLIRFDAKTGEQIWSFNTEHKLSSGVGANSGLVLVGTFKGEVLAFDGAGNSQWKAQVSSEVLSAPQIDSDMVVVRTVDGRVFGLDAIDGSRQWVYQGATPSLTVRSHAGALVSRGAVFAGFAGGKLAAMSLDNGNVGWESAVSQPRGVTELERMTDITSVPAADEQLVCSVAYQGRVACFDLIDGSQIWSREASSSAGLDMDTDYIYVSEEGGAVVAYDKRSGASVWKRDKLGSKKLTAPTVVGHHVVVADYLGFVTIFRNYDGSIVARSATDDSAIITAPAPLPNGFVVQTMEGGIYVFSTP